MKKQFYIYISFIVLSLLLSSCISSKSIYKPPSQENLQNKYIKEFNRPYNEIWDALINYSASTFFGIDNFEKESGLLTLSFGASNPQDYITGGYWKTDIVYGVNELHFEGDYVEYLSLYQNGSLVGKMNIVVKKIDDNNTRVVVNARYVFSTNATDANGRSYNNTWNFNTGGCSEIMVSNASKGTQPTRTLCPTYKAENAILSALE
ncbi:MAG: hypothetical protein CO129_07620 [Ignavibacteriales bacterium CG_4_9_14_3_um_filter_34_10]|nr:MAG: hypothetical protein CO129_07620 [Ignavibacteriales bacterium CG_4_9_14_3_um_filter_34_10]